MKETCIYNLDDLSHLLLQMSNEEYSKSCQLLFGASIGQHTRHIIELYLELIQGIKKNEICYDNRIRNILFETKITATIEIIGFIKANIKLMKDDYTKLKANYSNNENSIQLNTSIFRELAYNLEHSIHHQALIKIGLHELGKLDLINENFGVASSTIRFKKETIRNTN